MRGYEDGRSVSSFASPFWSSVQELEGRKEVKIGTGAVFGGVHLSVYIVTFLQVRNDRAKRVLSEETSVGLMTPLNR